MMPSRLFWMGELTVCIAEPPVFEKKPPLFILEPGVFQLE
jgi:hypothetical protein